MIVLDAHCDSPSQMYRLRDFGIDNSRGQVDFPKMKRGGVDASFFAAYIPASRRPEEATRYADALLDTVDAQMAANKDKAAYATTPGEVRENKEKGLTSVLLGIENASPIRQSRPLLEHFRARGVRYVTLTHSADNQVGDSCSGSGTWGGLSPFGKDFVAWMNESGMLIDLAHSADSMIKDVLAASRRPVAYTHGCCRSLASHRRNLPDDLIKGIADSGGIVCMSIYPCFLSDGFTKVLADSGLEKKMWVEDEFIADPADKDKRAAWWRVQDELAALSRPGIDRILDHIEHAVEVAGIDHVGIGTDYDGIEVTVDGLEDISKFNLLWSAMEDRGFSGDDIAKIAGGNFLRVLGEVQASFGG